MQIIAHSPHAAAAPMHSPAANCPMHVPCAVFYFDDCRRASSSRHRGRALSAPSTDVSSAHSNLLHPLLQKDERFVERAGKIVHSTGQSASAPNCPEWERRAVPREPCVCRIISVGCLPTYHRTIVNTVQYIIGTRYRYPVGTPGESAHPRPAPTMMTQPTRCSFWLSAPRDLIFFEHQ